MKILLATLLLFPILGHADPINYSCKYMSYSNEKGNHKVKETFKLNFIVDKKTGKSYLLGNNGSSEVIAFGGKNRISFIEVTATKNIMSTAIDSNLNSVHSRNTIIAGELLASQYYGKCEIK